MTTIHLFGGGGHAKVVIDTIYNSSGNPLNDPEIEIYDDREDLVHVLGLRVVGKLSELNNIRRGHFFVAIGDNAMRLKLLRKGEANPYIYSPTYIHQNAYVSPYAMVGPGSIVMAGAVIQPGARIGKGCIINTGATVDHDCDVADGVHVCPGVHLAGSVKVGECSQIGIGSSIIPGISIGENCIIGAGSVVIRDCNSHSVYFGNPAAKKGNIEC
jgi:sugar O-acyltransferase (sialic acid O-acetyltransferase NeuD family)